MKLLPFVLLTLFSALSEQAFSFNTVDCKGPSCTSPQPTPYFPPPATATPTVTPTPTASPTPTPDVLAIYIQFDLLPNKIAPGENYAAMIQFSAFFGPAISQGFSWDLYNGYSVATVAPYWAKKLCAGNPLLPYEQVLKGLTKLGTASVTFRTQFIKLLNRDLRIEFVKDARQTLDTLKPAKAIGLASGESQPASLETTIPAVGVVPLAHMQRYSRKGYLVVRKDDAQLKTAVPGIADIMNYSYTGNLSDWNNAMSSKNIADCQNFWRKCSTIVLTPQGFAAFQKGMKGTNLTWSTYNPIFVPFILGISHLTGYTDGFFNQLPAGDPGTYEYDPDPENALDTMADSGVATKVLMTRQPLASYTKAKPGVGMNLFGIAMANVGMDGIILTYKTGSNPNFLSNMQKAFLGKTLVDTTLQTFREGVGMTGFNAFSGKLFGEQRAKAFPPKPSLLSNWGGYFSILGNYLGYKVINPISNE